jgi:hypothetical protein
MTADDCGCGKPNPGPLGGKPRPGSMVASVGSSSSGSVTYVGPDGRRETMSDALAARAEVVRRGGGSIEFT